jgi:2-haloacid dehalogenase
MLDFDRYQVLSFDCYGTLIDWERGILASLRPLLAAHKVQLDDQAILALYSELESQAEKGPFVNYRQVLRRVMRSLGVRLGFQPTPSQIDHLGDTLKDWPAFPDSVAALAALKKRYKLAILSNIDDDLFAGSNKHLKVEFDWIVTAQQIGDYKPSLRNFEYALEKISVAPDRLLHVAQSLYHDIAPANQIGLSSVWVNRRHAQPGTGATPPASAKPDLEVPDLKTLVSTIGLAP